MTPPDSGEACNETLGEDRVVYQCSRPKGHVGQHRDGNVTAWDRKPDSGEREVRCTAAFAWSDGMVQCELPRGHDGRHDAARRVILPLSLAQRILAALEKYAETHPLELLLADELRARLPTANPRKG